MSLEAVINPFAFRRRELKDEINRLRVAGAESFRGEEPKSPLEKRAVDVLNEVLIHALGKLGFRKDPFPKERIHFLKEEYYAHATQTPSCGIYQSDNHLVAIKSNVHTPGDIIQVLAEEMLHGFSYKHYRNKEPVGAYPSRVGYVHRSLQSNFFVGFNEGVTNLLKREILTAYGPEIGTKLGLPEGETRAIVTDRHEMVYKEYIDFVEKLIGNTATSLNRDPQDVRRWFEQGLFAEHPHALHLVAKAYGKNRKEKNDAIQILGLLGIREDVGVSRKQIYEFFDEPSRKERRKKAKVILHKNKKVKELMKEYRLATSRKNPIIADK